LLCSQLHGSLVDTQRAGPASITPPTHVDEERLMRPEHVPRVRRLVDTARVVGGRAAEGGQHAEDELGQLDTARGAAAWSDVERSAVSGETAGEFAAKDAHARRRTYNHACQYDTI